MASSWSAPTSWYSHPIYARYWQHYHLAMAWMQSHQNAYRNAREHCLISPCSGQPLHDSSRAQPYAREDQALYEEEEVESESDDGIECDLSNMEITDELRQFFAETERHREERRQQQKLDAERLGDYVNADHGLYCDYQRSAEPPSERPGERRQAEMKRLYGDSAAKILAMEAAVQLNFDKCCDRKQPKYWPVIPLKF
ncbi:gem-associated protein 8 isoform X2 [Nannospalax galili]|uniref:gem-associated protein 8 isoform X2 n=1 Tax=Nannospalax galili TaxID=1026970 RepID=UPI000819C897|nr:gem-associated protein 8 isoform X2 [Nannospalax galili]